MNREKALEELKKINNDLTLLMKKKKALQNYIEEENARIGKLTPRQKAIMLKHDEKFIREYGRERTTREIALIMNYSERQINRFLKGED